MGGFCPICKIYWGGFCPSQQKRVGGGKILSGGGGGFCPDTANCCFFHVVAHMFAALYSTETITENHICLYNVNKI